jgi:hypothetical protein
MPQIIAGAAIGLGGISTIVQGIQADQAGRTQSKLLRIQAGQELQAGVGRAGAIGQEASRRVGTGIANAGAAGIDPGQGSAQAVLTGNIRQAQLDALYEQMAGERQAANLRTTANITKLRGKQTLLGGLLSGTGQIGTGLARGLT